MKYIFTVRIFGKQLDSKPLTKDELMETISVYLANNIYSFEVRSEDSL